MKPLILLLLAAAPVFRLVSTTVLSTDRMAAGSAVFSADGSRLAYLSNGHLFVMDVATRTTRDAGSWGRAGEMLAFAPDGKSMYIGQGQDLYLRSLEGSDDRRKILQHVWRTPKVSPDGKMLSFLRADRSTTVFVSNSDGSHERELAVMPSTFVRWSWLADGSAIAVSTWQVLANQRSKTTVSLIPCRPPGPLRQIAEWEYGPDPDMIWSADGSGFFANYGDGIGYYSISDHAWSVVADTSGLMFVRPAGPDGKQLAAERSRIVRTFWDSLLGMAGLVNGKREDELVLLRIEGK